MRTFRFFPLVLIVFSFLLIHACLKDNHSAPVVITKEVLEITTVSATSGGEISNNGGLNIISKGVCWDTADYPTDQNNSTNEAIDLQAFTSSMSNLSPHTKYYVRAYATNSTGIGYGGTMFFTTLGEVPTAVTSQATYITLTTATLNGTVNPNQLSASVTFEYGDTGDYGNSIIATQSPLSGDSATKVSANLTGLTSGKYYNFRIKVTNDLGTAYGTNQNFKTDEPLTLPATDTKTTSTILNGLANPHGLNSSLVFLVAKDNPNSSSLSYNILSVAIPSTVKGDSNTPITSSLTGLIPGTLYHYYLKMENDLGTFSGFERRFTTLPVTVITNEPRNISETSVTLTGIVNANNTDVSVAFEYGVYPFGYWNDEPGTTVQGTPSQVSGNTNTPVSVTITGLLPGKMYSYFFGASGQGWKIRSAPHEITTKNLLFNQDVIYGTMNDIEGNDYRTIQLGTQIWMAENLKTTQYNDGAPIPVGWSNVASESDSYQWYGNRGDYYADYGAMYNWYAVNTGKLCPVGWHVPTFDDWSQLVTYSGGNSIAGNNLKETGSIHWSSPNAGANNSIGFTAVGGGNNEDMAGLTDPGGTPWNLKSLSYYWVQNISGTNSTQVLVLKSNSAGTNFIDYYPNRYHCSIRCLKD